jgi:hypothetical protein
MSLKLEPTRKVARHAAWIHRGGVEIAVQAAAVMTAAMAVRAVQDGTRGLVEVGRRGF